MSPRGTHVPRLGAEAHRKVQQLPLPLDRPQDAGLIPPVRERRHMPQLLEAPVQPPLQTAEEDVNAPVDGRAKQHDEPNPRRQYRVGATHIVRAAQSLGCCLTLAIRKPLLNAQAPRSRNIVNHRLHRCGENDSGHYLGRGRSSGGVLEHCIPAQRSHPWGLAQDCKGGSNNKMPTKNPWFHQVLFDEYSNREVGEKRITSRSVRNSIKDQKIPCSCFQRLTGKRCAWLGTLRACATRDSALKNATT